MAVRLRLKRTGRKNRVFFRLGAFDTKMRRDGRSIEELGWYDPLVEAEDKRCSLKRERISYWLAQGALPSPTVENMLLSQGIDVPTSGRKRAATPEERAARDEEREQKRQKREAAMQRKAVLEAAGGGKAMSKKERREAKKAGGR